MTDSILAKDIMEANVVTLRDSDTLAKAWATLAEHRISGAPVLSDDGILVGVLSQSDLVRQAFLNELNHLPLHSYYIGAPFLESEMLGSAVSNLEQVLVQDAMSTDVITANEDDNIATLAVQMRSNHIHRLVITSDSSVVGIVTVLDLIKVLEQH